MKVICEGLELSDAVLKVIKGTSTRSTNPILEGIKVVAEEDKLILTATDLELAIEKTIKADVKIEGETVIPAKFFSEYIKKLTKEQIELNLDSSNILTIKCSDSIGKIQCFNGNEFVDIKKVDLNQCFELTKRDLKSLINKVIFAVAQDDIRPILKGCKLEIESNKITAVALDGFRLAKVEKPLISTTANFNIIVPARSLNEIEKLLDDNDELVKVYIDSNYLMVDLDNTKITTRLLTGDFINYKQIIPTNFTSTVTINKEQFSDAIDKASLVSRLDKNNLVKFDISEKVMVLYSKSEIGNFEENITISLSGNDLVIAFNAKYFADALKVIDQEFLKLNFTSTIAPCIITSTDSNEFLYLILPVRIM